MASRMKGVMVLAVAFSAGLIIADVSKADVVASYLFNPGPGDSAASNDTQANSDATSLTDGAGVESSITGPGNPTQSYQVSENDTASEAAAFIANDYITFTVTPDAGYELDLTNFTLDLLKSKNDAAGNFFLRSSVDTFTTTIGSGSTTNTVTGNGSYAPFTISLSGASFQNLTTATTFRIYSYGATDDKRELIHDNVILNGSVNVIPEPATLGLLSVGGLLLAARRRRSETAK